MIREFGRYTAFIGCASSNRSQNVARTQERFGEITWFVPQNEFDDYLSRGAGHLAVGSGANAADAYNRVFREAWEHGLPVISIDDDVFGNALLADCRGGHTKITHSEGLAIILERLMESDFAYGGMSKTSNAFWVKREVDTDLFMRGSLQVIKPCGVMHDTRFRVFHDMDYWLQHLKTFGGVLRCNDVIMQFETFQRGGLGDIRLPSPDGHNHHPDDPVALADGALLREKWGDLVGFRESSLVRPYVRRRKR